MNRNTKPMRRAKAATAPNHESCRAKSAAPRGKAEEATPVRRLPKPNLSWGQVGPPDPEFLPAAVRSELIDLLCEEGVDAAGADDFVAKCTRAAQAVDLVRNRSTGRQVRDELELVADRARHTLLAINQMNIDARRALWLSANICRARPAPRARSMAGIQRAMPGIQRASCTWTAATSCPARGCGHPALCTTQRSPSACALLSRCRSHGMRSNGSSAPRATSRAPSMFAEGIAETKQVEWSWRWTSWRCTSSNSAVFRPAIKTPGSFSSCNSSVNALAWFAVPGWWRRR